jgi:hypothetical protein
MLIRYEFINDRGIVLNTGIADCEDQKDFAENEILFREKFGYNDSLYNVETHEFYERCVKSVIQNIETLNVTDIMIKKLFGGGCFK